MFHRPYIKNVIYNVYAQVLFVYPTTGPLIL
jgi:hypothetical protein